MLKIVHKQELEWRTQQVALRPCKHLSLQLPLLHHQLLAHLLFSKLHQLFQRQRDDLYYSCFAHQLGYF